MDRRQALKKTGLWAGAAMATPSFLSLLQSCKNESRSEWQPVFLIEQEARTISTMVDMLLPRTETPGALDVKVDIFLDTVFAKAYDKEAQENVRAEITAFNDDCKKTYEDVFHQLSETDRIEVLKTSEKTSGTFNKGVWGVAVGEQQPVGFYRSLKSMAIWAYCTSEEIGKNVLNYDPIPQEYDGCVPLSEVGNRWTF